MTAKIEAPAARPGTARPHPSVNMVRMSRRSRAALPPADPAAARSWVGQTIKDAYTADSFGVVHGVEEGDDGKVRLLVRFAGETADRRVLLQKPDEPADVEFLLPGDARARYRTLTDADEGLLAARRGD